MVSKCVRFAIQYEEISGFYFINKSISDYRLQPLENVLSVFSVFTKMATVYSYVFPLLYLHSPEFYIRTLLASIGSNVVMTLLKWSVYFTCKRFF